MPASSRSTACSGPSFRSRCSSSQVPANAGPAVQVDHPPQVPRAASSSGAYACPQVGRHGHSSPSVLVGSSSSRRVSRLAVLRDRVPRCLAASGPNALPLCSNVEPELVPGNRVSMPELAVRVGRRRSGRRSARAIRLVTSPSVELAAATLGPASGLPSASTSRPVTAAHGSELHHRVLVVALQRDRADQLPVLVANVDRPRVGRVQCDRGERRRRSASRVGRSRGREPVPSRPSPACRPASTTFTTRFVAGSRSDVHGRCPCPSASARCTLYTSSLHLDDLARRQPPERVAEVRRTRWWTSPDVLRVGHAAACTGRCRRAGGSRP